MASCVATTTLMDYAASCVQTTSSGKQIDVIEIIAPNASSSDTCRDNNTSIQVSMKLDSTVWQNLGDLWTAIIEALNPFQRNIRNQAVPLILGVIGGRAAGLYRDMLNKERSHIMRVRQSVREALNIADSRHDYSKDAYYVFIICGKFGGVEAVSERFAAEYTTETRRHFGLESHHPEYESINAARHLHCNEVSIAEMAIDRLDRNLAPSGGRDPIDWNLMNKYKPVFSSGDVEGKQMLFLQYVHDYESVVRRVILASGGGHSVTSKSPTVAAETADDRKEVEGGFVLVDNLDADESESESLCRGCHHHRKKPSISFVSGRVTIVI